MSIDSNTLAISINHVSYRFVQDVVLDDINFDIHIGEYIGIIGDNGSGKSTLLQIILNLKHDFEGSVNIFGKPNNQFCDWKKIGFVPQKHSLSSSPLNVRELIRTGHIRKGVSFEKSLEHQSKLLRFESILDRNIADLSGGELQKILIARGMINNPELLILDEPTVAIDPETREELLDYIHTLHQNNNVTILHVTHNIEQIKHNVDRILCISNTNIFESHNTVEHVHSYSTNHEPRI